MTREEKLVEALQWCGGSADFNEGGKARKGWLKTCAPLLKEPASIAQQPKPGSQKTLTQICSLHVCDYCNTPNINPNRCHLNCKNHDHFQGRKLRALA